MSITAGWIALAVIIARLLIKKAPKWISVLLWALVGVRLVCPVSLESVLSLVPSTQTVPPEILYSDTPTIESGIGAVNAVINPVISESFAPSEGASVNPLQVIAFIASVVWVVGIIGMLLYSAISYFILRKKVSEAVRLDKNVYLCDRVSSPFILGLIVPKIYIPSDMDKEDMRYVLAHENAHLKRCDHLWKPLAFLLLSVYWFNPILWVSYILLCRDIELACDEKVIKGMGDENKKPYSEALINCSIPRKVIAACPLAFGEVGVKGRIKSVLNYKKPAFWIIIAAVVLSIVLAVCLLTNPETEIDAELIPFIDCEIASRHQSQDTEGRFSCLDWELIDQKKTGNKTTVYLWTLYGEYSYDKGLVQEKLVHTPTLISFEKNKGSYELVEYFEPDGNGEVKDRFPSHLLNAFTSPDDYYADQLTKLEEMAGKHFADVYNEPVYDKTEEITFSASTINHYNTYVDEMIEAGAAVRNDYHSADRRHLPVVKISSTKELEYFKEKMGGASVLDIKWSDVPSFEELSHKYVDSYFEDNTLLLIYACSAGGENDRFCIDSVQEIDGVLTIDFMNVIPFSHHSHFSNWMIGVDIPKSYDLSEVRAYDAVIASYLNYKGAIVKSTIDIDMFDYSVIVKRYVNVQHSNVSNSPAVTLFNNGMFSLVYSQKSEHISYGNYKLADTRLTLYDVNGDVFYFDIKDGLISFDEKASSELYDESIIEETCDFIEELIVNGSNKFATYSFKDIDSILKPTLYLYNNGIFNFTHATSNNYRCFGKYEIKDKHLILNTDDGKYVYCFDISNISKIVFDAKSSTVGPLISEIKDGSVLKLYGTPTPKYTFTVLPSGSGDVRDFYEAGGKISKFYYSGAYRNTLRCPAFIKISSKTELDDFVNKTKTKFNHENLENYTDDFFEKNTLLLIYAHMSNEPRNVTVGYIEKIDSVLSVGIDESYDNGDKAFSYPLIQLNLPNEYLENVDMIDMYYLSPEYPYYGTLANNKLFRRYVCVDSKFSVKPSLTLYNDKRFAFVDKPDTAVVGFGSYELNDGRLKLNFDSGEVCYFNESGPNIIFDAEASDEMYNHPIIDGQVFIHEKLMPKGTRYF